MKTKQNLCIICMMLLISSCKDCKQCNYTQYETAPVILEYFGNYRPGNYWIYENQDGTKKDSIWVSDYSNRLMENEFQCYKDRKIDFYINSQYLHNQSRLSAKILIDIGSHTVFITDQAVSGRRIIQQKGYSSADTLYNTEVKSNVQYLSHSTLAFPIVSISVVDNIDYAKYIGISRYVSNRNTNDTFYLTKYFIK